MLLKYFIVMTSIVAMLTKAKNGSGLLTCTLLSDHLFVSDSTRRTI